MEDKQKEVYFESLKHIRSNNTELSHALNTVIVRERSNISDPRNEPTKPILEYYEGLHKKMLDMVEQIEKYCHVSLDDDVSDLDK